MAKSKVVIQLEVDSTGAVKKIDTFKGKVNQLPTATKKASAGLGKMTAMLGGLGLAMGAVKIGRFLQDTIQASAEQERTFSSLANTMGNVGVAFNDASGELQGMFANLQKTTKFGDTETADALQRLIATTGNYDSALKLLQPTLNFAVGGNIDLATAARLAGQAATGMTGTLSRYGIILDEATKKQLTAASASEKAAIVAGILQSKFGGAAQANLQTYGGRVAQLGNYWGDFKEAIGDVITKVIAAPGVFDLLLKSFEALVEGAKNFGEVMAFAFGLDWGVMIEGSIALAINRVKAMLADVYDILSELPGKIGDHFADLTTELRKEVEATGDSVERAWTATIDEANKGAIEFREAVDGLTISMGDFKNEVVETVAPLSDLKVELEAIEILLDFGSEAITENWKALGKQQQGIEETNAGLAEYNQQLNVATFGTKRFTDVTVKSNDIIMNSFSELLSKGFTGELESFADLWNEIWKDLAKSMTGILGDAFQNAMKDGGTVGGVAVRFFDNMKQQAAKNPLGSALAGAGSIMQGREQGGAGGALQGALGGAMMGLNPALMAATGGLSVVAGAVIGAAISFFGSKEKSPRIYGGLALDGSHRVLQSDTDLSVQARAVWAQERIAEYQKSIMAMNNVLRLFKDGDLFDLVGGAPSFRFDDDDLDTITTIFQQKWLPDAMRSMFKSAINRGLKNFDVGADTRKQLWKEINALTGGDRIIALESFIGSLVGVAELLDDLDWNAILDETRQNSMQSFVSGMGSMIEQTQTAMLGLDTMTLLQRAEQASTVEQLVRSARNAEIQMLRQIDSLQKGINDSIDAQIEGLHVGGLDKQGSISYYREMIQGIMGELRSGEGMSSPEQVQALMADLQRYVQAYQGAVGDDALYEAGPMGSSRADWLMRILEEGRGISNETLDGFRDQVREINEALIAELRTMYEALTSLNVTLNQPPGTFDVDLRLDVDVRAGDGFWANIDARIARAEWASGHNGGVN